MSSGTIVTLSNVLLALLAGALAYLAARYITVARSAPVIADQWRAALFQGPASGIALAAFIAVAAAIIAYALGERGTTLMARQTDADCRLGGVATAAPKSILLL